MHGPDEEKMHAINDPSGSGVQIAGFGRVESAGGVHRPLLFTFSPTFQPGTFAIRRASAASAPSRTAQ
jgi:hypothetical protein